MTRKIKFTLRKLSDFCTIEKGKFSATKTTKGKYPLVVTAEGRLTASSFQFDAEAVCIPIVSSTGHGHASLNRIHYQKGEFALASILASVIPDPKICNPKYLYYLLSLKKNELLIPLMRGGANVTLGITPLSNLEIPLPSYKIQTKLIKVSELFQSLRDKQNIQKQITKDLVESFFLKIFGEPVKNTKKWPTRKLGELTEKITLGATPTTYGFDWEDKGILFLRSQCVTPMGINLTGSMRISRKAHDFLKRSQLKPNDVLIRITGDVGESVVFPNALKEANINQHISKIRLKTLDITPEYLSSMFNTRYYIHELRSITHGNWPHLTLKQIGECKIPIPPKNLQKFFSTILKNIQHTSKKQDRYHELSKDFFASIMNIMF